MAKHTFTYREEMRYPVGKWVMVICACGFEEKAQNMQEAKSVVGKHLKDVVNDMKPQKSLDI